MLKTEMIITKKYLIDCCTNGVKPQDFDATPEAIDEAVMGLTKQLVYAKTALLAEDELADLNRELATPNSPEQLLDQASAPALNDVVARITQAIVDQGGATTNTAKRNSVQRYALKNQIEPQLNSLCEQLVRSLPNEIKQVIAATQYKRRQKILHERDIGGKRAAINRSTGNNDFLLMSLQRANDPLYSRDMVQHLIRLRLQAPDTLQASFAPNQPQAAITRGHRAWLGLYELCDLIAPDLQPQRLQDRATLTSALNSAIHVHPTKELYISVRARDRGNSGHYLMMALIPCGDHGRDYTLRHIDTLRSPATAHRGIPGELQAIAQQCQIQLSGFESRVLIHQPTNQGCGPTHVETTVAIMTQTCLYGEVPSDYMSTSIHKPERAHRVLAEHMRLLVSNPLTLQATIARGEEECIFRLVETGKSTNDFGYIPPMPEHLEDEPTSINRLQDPHINGNIHRRDAANPTPLQVAINSQKYELAKTMLLMSTDTDMKNHYKPAEIDRMIDRLSRSKNNLVLLAKLRAAKTPEGTTATELYKAEALADFDLASLRAYIDLVESQRKPINGKGGKENPQEEYRLQHALAKKLIMDQYQLKVTYYNQALVASLIGLLLPIISHIIIWSLYLLRKPDVHRVEVNADTYTAMKNENRKNTTLFSAENPSVHDSAIRQDPSTNSAINFGQRYRKILTKNEGGQTLSLFFANEKQQRHCLSKIKDYETRHQVGVLSRIN